jgi:tungstate transport system substrate-binding protein
MSKHSFRSVNLSMSSRKMRFFVPIVSILLILFLSFTACGSIADKNLTLATTTSVNDSGLMDYLKPVFEKATGMNLKIISQGTGQAVKTGQDGNADVLLIHDKASEEKFVSDGYGLKRIELAYNYFVIVGPKDDPAGLAQQKYTAAEAFKKIAESKSTFVSRGDDSGTNKKELKIWKEDGIKPEGDWYNSAGKGMGAVLSMADEKKAYTLTDKATYLSMKDKLDLKIMVDATADLLNQYTIIEVNPDKHKDINKAGADKFVKWMTSDKALKMIDEYGKDKYGEGLFKVDFGGIK